jgi:hypothetical protein
LVVSVSVSVSVPVSVSASGEDWVGYDVEAEHSKNLPSDPWDSAHGTGTTSYTGNHIPLRI